MKKEAEKYGIPYEKMGRVLVWHDEFDKEKLDETKWGFYRTMGAGDRFFCNDERFARMEGDKFLMQVHRCTDVEGADFALPEGLNTREQMNFKYGYVEMCACLPYRHGAWPSFWMKSDTPFSKSNWMSEIDILEAYSSDREFLPCIHKWAKGLHAACTRADCIDNDRWVFENYENLNNEYHVYGMEWNEKELKFYVDDVYYCTLPIDEERGNYQKEIIDGVDGFHDFHYLIMNNEIFSEGGYYRHSEESRLNDSDVLPINYYIDWVRLYQKDGEELKLLDEIQEAKKG